MKLGQQRDAQGRHDYFSGWFTNRRKGRSLLLILTASWLMLVGRYNHNDLFLIDVGSSASSLKSSSGHCPAVIEQARGIYKQDHSGDNKNNNSSTFDRVVLLTAANYGYYDILQNWEYLARAQGLQWAVLALDDRLYKEIGSSRAVPNTSPEYAVRGAVEWGTPGFRTVSCNKVRSVLRIMEDCDVDVVFSDCDNVFFRNPFDHDLGRMIQMGQYDYIYQVNEPLTSKNGGSEQDRQHPCLKRGQPVKEGNSGFYYMSRHSESMKRVIRKTLDECSKPDNKLTEQTLFWKVLSEQRKLGMTRHCNATEVDAAANDPALSTANRILPNENTTTAKLCCLDPYYYPVGKNPFEDHNVFTYHANYVFGKKRKVHLLKHARSDGYGFSVHRVKACRFPWILVRKKCWSLWWA